MAKNLRKMISSLLLAVFLGLSACSGSEIELPTSQLKLPSEAPAVAKPSATNLPIASFLPSCRDLSDPFYNSLSPRGNWLAVVCGYDQTLTIYDDSGERWNLQFKDYVSEESIVDGQPPRGSLYPIHWANDEKYLFFRSVIGFSGGGTCFYGHAGQGLYRIDLETGAVSATLRPLIGHDGYILSFSPTGQWLAFNAGIPTLLNLQTGEKVFLQEERIRLGIFPGHQMEPNWLMELVKCRRIS